MFGLYTQVRYSANSLRHKGRVNGRSLKALRDQDEGKRCVRTNFCILPYNMERCNSTLKVYSENSDNKNNNTSIKRKVTDFIKKNKMRVFGGGSVVGISSLSLAFGLGNVAKVIGGTVMIPLLVVLKLFIQHMAARANIQDVLKTKIVESRREIEALIGPVDVESNMIHIHSAEKYRTQYGDFTTSLMAIVKIHGAYGIASGKVMAVLEKDEYVLKVFDVEYINFRTGKQGLHQFVHLKPSVPNVFNIPRQKETIKKVLFTLSSDKNTVWNTPLIALARISFYLQKRKGKPENDEN